MLGLHGTLGFVATNTIAQGDTRESGLLPILRSGGRLFDVRESIRWAGEAAVTISTLHIAVGRLAAGLTAVFNGVPVAHINSRLKPQPERAEPVALHNNEGLNYNGVNTGGSGFLISSAERQELLRACPEAARRLPMFVGGDDINNDPSWESTRFVIDFSDLDLEEARRFQPLMNIVVKRVKPTREQSPDNAHGRRLKERWWQFREAQPALRGMLLGLPRCLVCGVYPKHLAFVLRSTVGVLFNNKVSVFGLDTYTSFAVLQSRVFEPWARRFSPTMGAADSISFAPSKCFLNFPFPHSDPRNTIDQLEEIGRAVHEARTTFQQAEQAGLTSFYDRVKSSDDGNPAITRLRALHEALDRAVLAAYDWGDIAVPPYTTPATPEEEKALEAFQDEVIDRLFVLNAARAKEEELANASGTKPRGKAKAAAKGPKPGDANQLHLLDKDSK
jgi:hypothetical protein